MNCTEGEVKVLSHSLKGQGKNLNLCSRHISGVGKQSWYSELGAVRQDSMAMSTLSFLASEHGGLR